MNDPFHEIRRLDPSEAEAYVALHARAYSCALEEIRSSEFIRVLLSLEEVTCLGAWIESRLIGVGCGISLGVYGAILECVVDPEYRRRGVGTVLLRGLIERVTTRAEFCIIQVPITVSWELRWLTLEGFQCVEPQFLLRKQLDEAQGRPDQEPKVSQWQDLIHLREFGKELQASGLGQLVEISAEESSCGMAFVELAPRRRMPSTSVAISFGNVARALSGAHLRSALVLAEEVARHHNRSGVVVTMNSWYKREIEQLMRDRWSLIRVSHRLVHVGGLSRYRQIQSLPQIDLSHWSL